MATETTLTLKEAIEQLQGFIPYTLPQGEEGENLGINIIPKQKLLELNKKGAQLYIDKKSKYIFLHDGRNYFVYLGFLPPGSIVVSKEDIKMGLTIEDMAKVLNSQCMWSDEEYMKKFGSMLSYHVKVLETLGLIEKAKLTPINEYRA